MIVEWVNLVYIWHWLLVVYLFETDLAQRCLLFQFFPCRFPVSLLVVISPVPFPERNDVPLSRGFSVLYLIIPFATQFFTSFSFCPSIPSPHFQCPTLHSFMPQPCLSCSRFSFCWLVLIGLKWVTSSITQSFKPPLNVSVSWGSGSIVVLSFPPLAALPIGGETPGLMGWQRFGLKENP